MPTVSFILKNHVNVEDFLLKYGVVIEMKLQLIFNLAFQKLNVKSGVANSKNLNILDVQI